MLPLRATLAKPARESLNDPAELARLLKAFFAKNPSGAALEDGRALFELSSCQYRVSLDGGRCMLHLWDSKRQVVRHVEGMMPRADTLRLTTRRFGHAAPRTLVLAQRSERREPSRREPARQAYLRLLERALARHLPEWQPEAFRAAMDLEHSFGPAYARGVQVRGSEAWAVIGVAGMESQAVVDGVLAPGILWLHHCRERGNGRRRFRGLRVVVPPGKGELTLARLPWMHTAAAEWQMLELDERTEVLTLRDPADCGNLRTRLVHHPDLQAARSRFAGAMQAIAELVPPGEVGRVEHRLRSTAELAFLLHGLEFAKARISLAPGTFTHTLELTVGAGTEATPLIPASEDRLRAHVADLFARRNPNALTPARRLRPFTPGNGIGSFTGRPAHARSSYSGALGEARGLARLDAREKALAAQGDPLFRAQPERWLESALRENLAPLTRSLAPLPTGSRKIKDRFADDDDPDTRGNRSDIEPLPLSQRQLTADPLISRFDPRFVYTQVPAIAGASDRGMLDLLGVTEDGRLAVIELKTSDDLQLPLQGLDYWIRVRHHHAGGTAPPNLHGGTTGSELQQHGYFREIALSSLPPRLFLVAPALHIHPAAETILRYLSPRVEWTLLALDERWRQDIRVLWRKSGGLANP